MLISPSSTVCSEIQEIRGKCHFDTSDGGEDPGLGWVLQADGQAEDVGEDGPKAGAERW